MLGVSVQRVPVFKVEGGLLRVGGDLFLHADKVRLSQPLSSLVCRSEHLRRGLLTCHTFIEESELTGSRTHPCEHLLLGDLLVGSFRLLLNDAIAV